MSQRAITTFLLLGVGLFFANFFITCDANPYEEQLYQDLLYDYFKVVRPVKNFSDRVKIEFGAKFIRLIGLDEKSQVLTTNLWLDLRWKDPKLSWDPDKYDGIVKVRVPADQLWLPDIVLYTNAMGDYQITIYSDATVYYDGQIVWQPPAIYKSFCEIDIALFPYDEQECQLKFGLWSYDAVFVNVVHLREKKTFIVVNPVTGEEEHWCTENAMDLDYFYESGQWDIMNITSARHDVIYASCCGISFYIDLTFNIQLRRKPLFYTVNLVIPCIMIAMLPTFVFYLSDHKMTFSISILVTLSVFLNVLVDLLPPTSIVLPLVGKYVLFSMFLVTASIVVTVINLNFKYRSAATHGPVPKYMKKILIQWLPAFICLSPFKGGESNSDDERSSLRNSTLTVGDTKVPIIKVVDEVVQNMAEVSSLRSRSRNSSPKCPKLRKQRSLSNQRHPSPVFSVHEFRHTGLDQSQQPQLGFKPSVSARLTREDSRGKMSAQSSFEQSSFDVDDEYCEIRSRDSAGSRASKRRKRFQSPSMSVETNRSNDLGTYSAQALRQRYIIMRMLDNVNFIADHFKRLNDEDAIADEWAYLSVVLDRICLFIFFIVNTFGTCYMWKPILSFSTITPFFPTSPNTPLGSNTLAAQYINYTGQG